MSNSLNLNAVVENLKIIADAIRCTICDSQSETKLRFSCGHIACANCTEGTSLCFLCLTPPPEGSVPVIDESLTNRTRNALLLLKEFKDAYNIDIERWRRDSRQLKLEREVFPQCIQAPQTYGNKQKTDNTTGSDKENSYLFPGELVVHAKHKMNRSRSYVQEWLDQNEKELSDYKPRTPFSDLAVNSPMHKSTTIKKRADIILDKVKQNRENIGTNIRETPARSKKRQHFVARPTHKSQYLDNYLKCIEKGDSSMRSAKKVKREFDKHEKKNEKDESGIVMDDDAVIVIDDSQSEANNKAAAVDKDRLAWLAVLEADRNTYCAEKLSTDLRCDEIVKYTDEVEKSLIKNDSDDKNTPTSPNMLRSYIPSNDCVNVNIPFYKRGCLKESCRDCEKSAKRSINAKDVSITVETDTLRTTITVSKCTNKRPLRTSQKVQTEETTESQTLVESKLQQLLQKSREDPVCMHESEDLFTLEQNVASAPGPPAQLGPETSDSEQDFVASGEVTVKADVHRSVENETYAVLREKSPAPPRRRAPAASPASSNSSDKENRDPNTLRRRPIKKKKLFL